jgi:putative oxidoreductase
MNSRALRFLAFSLGFLLLFHGVDRIIYGVDSIENMFIAYVVPSSQYSDPCSICFNYGTAFMGKMIVPYSFPYSKYLTYGVYISEIVAPIFLIFGRYIRIASVIIALNMCLVLFLVYKNRFFELNENGGWSIELPLLYLLISITLIFGKRENHE